MAIRRYSRDELLALRDSPLVVKPDHLPAIEQWIEYVYLESKDGVREKLRIPHSEAQQHQASQQQTTSKENGGSNARQRQPRAAASAAGGMGDGASPMGSFSTGQRPSLLHMRSGTSRGQGDDVSLGPPRTTFPSSSRVSKLSDFHDRTESTASASDEPESARSRFFSDRSLNRKGLTSEREGRDSRESWRERRPVGDSDDHAGRDRHDRFARHDKDQDGERRNGFGDRHESRWGARDERRQNGDRTGGWREREHQRRERDNDRGHTEKEPEWMDDPVVKKDQELNFGMAKTQEEFQKWKEGMNKKSKAQPDKEEVDETPVDKPPPESKPDSRAVPLRLDGMETTMFSGWGSSTKSTTTVPTPSESTSVSGKPSAAKGKSRFASMFKPAPEEAPILAEEPPASQRAAAAAAATAADMLLKTSLEDQEGFNRVLQMLGSTKVGQTPSQGENAPASPPPNKTIGSNGGAARSKSRFTDIFEQKSPERLQSPAQQGGFPISTDRPVDGHVRHLTNDSLHSFGGRLPDRSNNEQASRNQASVSSMSAEGGIPFNALREQQPRPSSGRITEPHLFSPPSRGAATPDINIQNLLAQQRSRTSATSSESQQLLNLLRRETGSRPPSQQQQPMPSNGGIDSAQFQQWIENQHSGGPSGEPHAPKPRMPQPPGFLDEQLMRNFSGDQIRHEQTPSMGGQDAPQRRVSQRIPPGFLDEQSVFLQQQQHQHQQSQPQQLRRHYTDGPQQPPMQQPNPRLGGHPHLHPIQIALPQGGSLGYNPDFHQLTSPGGANGPPPGFNPMVARHPSNYHNMPNMFSNTMQPREGPLAPGYGGGVSGVGGPPPGFVSMSGMGQPPPPPGFHPQMRSPIDGGYPPGLQRGGVPQGSLPGRSGAFDHAYDPGSGVQPRR